MLGSCFSARVGAPTTTEVPATFDIDHDRGPVIALNGVWLFHPGDYPDSKLGWA
jgi:hypothetical protein